MIEISSKQQSGGANLAQQSLLLGRSLDGPSSYLKGNRNTQKKDCTQIYRQLER